MPHIAMHDGLPGILGPMAFRPETAKPLNELCHSSHGAAAAHHLGGDDQLVDAVRRDPASAAVSAKLRALLAIAGRVQEGGHEEGYVRSGESLAALVSSGA